MEMNNNEYFIELDKIEKQYNTNTKKSMIKNVYNEFSKKALIHVKEAVLGYDIYKYSEYKEHKQNLIPIVFDLIFKETISSLKHSGDLSLFQTEIERIKSRFISTGDGGYLFFSTPLHALVFNLHFYSVLHMFNTRHFFPSLSKYVGNIIIRSAITFNNVYEYGSSSYGKAIIDNSRILSKDRLNRFIIDKMVFNYFNKYFNGIESLPIITVDFIENILSEKMEKMTFFRNNENNESQRNDLNMPVIRNVHVQKIEDLLSKNTKLQLYNIEIQYSAKWFDTNEQQKPVTFILTIGNLNVNNMN